MEKKLSEVLTCLGDVLQQLSRKSGARALKGQQQFGGFDSYWFTNLFYLWLFFYYFIYFIYLLGTVSYDMQSRQLKMAKKCLFGLCGNQLDM